MTMNIGFIIFPHMQLLDLTAPYDVFATVPSVKLHLISQDLQPVITTSGIAIAPTTTIELAPSMDILCIVGGVGVNALIENQAILDFIHKQAQTARYICSICTGALLLGAAGLLKGKRATTHWSAIDFLPEFGAIFSNQRVVKDSNIITAGGVTAGIDFGLEMIARLFDASTAKKSQLYLQYDPQPPFDCGTPDKADPEIVETLTANKDSYNKRQTIIKRWQEKSHYR